MKTDSLARKCRDAGALVLLVAGAATCLAQNTNPTNSFDSDASIASFQKWWGIAPDITWDPVLDAGNDPSSGSVRYVVPFTEAGGEQFMVHWTIANRWQWDNGFTLDATTYTNLSFDIKVDPESFPIKSGANYGNLQVGLTTRTSWDNRISPPNYTIPLSATNWTHVDIPINPTWNFLNEVVGFFTYMWSDDAHTNNLIFNLDNVNLTKPTTPVVIQPPTVSLAKATPGLNLIASTGVQYERRNIRSVDTGLGWVDSPEPVTYSMNILKAPGAESAPYQAHIFLVPAEPNDDASSVDWNVPNIVWLHIENLANGGGQATFRYKTNHPAANAMLFNSDPGATNAAGDPIGVGNLGTVTSTAIRGEWKVTLENVNQITVTAPDGASTNLTMPSDAAALFSGGLRVYYGIQANNDTQYGKGYVIKSVKVSTPTRTLLEDNFTGETLDTDKWEKRAGDANNSVLVVPPNGAWWLNWTLPAVGYSPLVSTNLATTDSWNSLSSTNQYTLRGTRRTLVFADEIAPSAAFFRMMKRQYTKLQILLPGETAAPGTPTGKTGTPDPIQMFTVFDLVVNAVDDEWYPISGINNTIHLATDDVAGFLAPDGQLVNGTATFTGSYLGQEGNWTITATDVTDPEKGVGTSSPVTVTP